MLYAQKPGVGPHGSRRTNAAVMINQCKKPHRAENLSSCSYSAFCDYAAAAAPAAMMFPIGGRKKGTDLVWRLKRRRLGSRPPWSDGVCSLANLPSKTQPTTTPQRPSTPGAATCNSRTECWLIVICGSTRSEAPWRPWDDGGRHGRWVHGLASFYLAKTHVTKHNTQSIRPDRRFPDCYTAEKYVVTSGSH